MLVQILLTISINQQFWFRTTLFAKELCFLQDFLKRLIKLWSHNLKHKPSMKLWNCFRISKGSWRILAMINLIQCIIRYVRQVLTQHCYLETFALVWIWDDHEGYETLNFQLLDLNTYAKIKYFKTNHDEDDLMPT